MRVRDKTVHVLRIGAVGSVVFGAGCGGRDWGAPLAGRLPCSSGRTASSPAGVRLGTLRPAARSCPFQKGNGPFEKDGAFLKRAGSFSKRRAPELKGRFP